LRPQPRGPLEFGEAVDLRVEICCCVYATLHIAPDNIHPGPLRQARQDAMAEEEDQDQRQDKRQEFSHNYGFPNRTPPKAKYAIMSVRMRLNDCPTTYKTRGLPPAICFPSSLKLDSMPMLTKARQKK
jgi:hypothetical protein